MIRQFNETNSIAVEFEKEYENVFYSGVCEVEYHEYGYSEGLYSCSGFDCDVQDSDYNLDITGFYCNEVCKIDDDGEYKVSFSSLDEETKNDILEYCEEKARKQIEG